MGALGLVRVLSNTDLRRAEEKTRAQVEAVQAQPPTNGLAGYIDRFWQSAQSAKRSIEQTMLRNLRQRNGIYEPSDLALIREQGGSEIYVELTSAKCRGIESWLREVLLPDTGELPIGLEPTPMPDLPPAVSQAIVQALTQEALAAGWELDDQRLDERLTKIKWLAYRRMKDLSGKVAQRHELKIADQFTEGGWERALSDSIYDLATFPAAFIKGPVIRKARGRKWIPTANGQWFPQVTDILRPEYERRSPFDIFPAATMRDIRYGNLIDRYRFTRGELQTMCGVEGYSEDAIYQVLEQYGMKGYSSRQMSDFEPLLQRSAKQLYVAMRDGSCLRLRRKSPNAQASPRITALEGSGTAVASVTVIVPGLLEKAT